MAKMAFVMGMMELPGDRKSCLKYARSKGVTEQECEFVSHGPGRVIANYIRAHPETSVYVLHDSLGLFLMMAVKESFHIVDGLRIYAVANGQMTRTSETF